jgi:hypothetical protein
LIYGGDRVTYATRTAPLRVDLADAAADGEAGEGDTLLNIESVEGGSGDDQLLGDDGRNSLFGGRGRDRLAGRGGGDTLLSGFGGGTLSCGAAPTSPRPFRAIRSTRSAKKSSPSALASTGFPRIHSDGVPESRDIA